MVVPNALKALAITRRFWTDFFWSTESEEDDYSALEETVRLDFPVTSQDDCPFISLELSNDLSYFDLQLRAGSEPAQLGWDDQAHWHPHVLRWKELDLICRAVARLNPDLPHPGLPLLLLHRFAPICGQRGGEDDDADLATPLLDAAWRRLGLFSDREIQKLIERNDAREAGFRWRPGRTEGSWVLIQELGEDEEERASLRALYTLRSDHTPVETGSSSGDDEGNDGDDSEEEEWEDDVEPFPHGSFNTMLDAARETVLRTSGGEPVPDGVLVSERPPQPPYTLRSKYSLRLQLPMQEGSRPLIRGLNNRLTSPLNRILTDLDLGSAQMSSIIGRMQDGVKVTTESSIDLQIDGDLPRGMQIVHQTLHWGGAPETVRGWRGQKEVTLNLDHEDLPTGELCFQLTTFLAPQDERPTLFRATFPATCADALQTDPEAMVQDADIDGWLRVAASDGGELGVCFTPREDNKDFVAGSIAVRQLSPALVGIIYRLLSSQGLALFPPGLVTAEVPTEMEAATTVIKSGAELHEILLKGPYAWWSRPADAS